MNNPSSKSDTQPVNSGARPGGTTVAGSGPSAGSVPVSLPLPARLGPYEIRGMLGQGGMGIVYSAFDPGLERPIAVKVLAPVLANNPEYRERFLREARAMAAVLHRNIAQVHFAGEENGAPFFAMELVHGESATDRLKNTPLEVDTAVDVVLQAASGLQAAHAADIIHRDVKPSNLMCGNDGVVKVLDFGLARAPSHRHITATDMIMGSPDYMSPEQGRGQEPDHRSDIYGLGATLYHLIAGNPPFGGSSALAIINAHIHEPCPPLDAVRDGVPERVCRIVERMMAKDPDRRYQGYAQLMHDLASVRESAEAQAFRYWNDTSPHNEYWKFCRDIALHPAKRFTRCAVERADSEIDGVLARAAAFSTIAHAMCVPMEFWGPHQILLYGAFAVGVPLFSLAGTQLACRLLRLRATRLELKAVEFYACVCLFPAFLFPRVNPVTVILWAIACGLYVRARAAGLAFVTGTTMPRAVAIALVTLLATTIVVGGSLKAGARAFAHYGYYIRALPSRAR